MSNEKTLARKGYPPMQYVHIIITLLLMFGFGYLPTFSTLTPVGMKLLGLFLGVIYGYSTCEVIWPSLFAFIAFGLSGYTDMNRAISSMLGGSTVFQIITQYFTAGAIVIYGFGKWFIRWSLTKKIFRGKPMFYTWCFMFIFMWTGIVISQIPMALLLYAIWADIADSCGYEKGSTFRYYGFGGILLSLMMGGAMIPVVSPFVLASGMNPVVAGAALIWIANMGLILPGASAPASIFHGRSEIPNAGLRTKVVLFSALLMLVVSIVVFSVFYLITA